MNAFKLTPLEERIVLDAAAIQVIFVDVNAAAGGDGSSWRDAFQDLQSALAEAELSAGADQIWVADGTYYPTTGTDRSATFNIPDETSVYGGFAGFESKLSQRNISKNVTILSGNIGAINDNTDNSYTVVSVGLDSAVQVKLDGITVTQGYNDGSSNGGNGGGLIELNGSDLYLSSMIFKDNYALNRGAGIYTEGNPDLGLGTLTVIKSTFTGNTGGELLRGGGIRTTFMQSVEIIDSTFSNNSSLIGAGAYSFGDVNVTVKSSNFVDNTTTSNAALQIVFGTNVLVEGNLIKNNYGPFDGGGLFAFNENLTIKNNIWENNTADAEVGTGAFASESNGTVLVTGNLFLNNSAVDAELHSGAGGAIATIADVSITITKNTFIGNVSDYGGAIIAGSDGTENTLVITKNIFKNNQAIVEGGALSLGTANATLELAPDFNVTVSDNLFLNNKAGEKGGAIASQEEIQLTIDRNIFTLNKAPQGGAIADTSTELLFITSNVFAANSASTGRSLWLDGGQGTVNGLPVNPHAALIDQLASDNVHLLEDDIFIV